MLNRAIANEIIKHISEKLLAKRLGQIQIGLIINLPQHLLDDLTTLIRRG
jgi:hypothetical protein